MKNLKKGVLISFEGIDGSGKSLLVNNLYKILQTQYKTLITKEPGETDLGKKIRKIVQEQNVKIGPLAEYLLFATDRAQHFTEFIIPNLQEKYLILSDRLADSSIVYNGYGRDLPINKIK
jgi:dTMP kinase